MGPTPTSDLRCSGVVCTQVQLPGVDLSRIPRKRRDAGRTWGGRKTRAQVFGSLVSVFKHTHTIIIWNLRIDRGRPFSEYQPTGSVWGSVRPAGRHSPSLCHHISDIFGHSSNLQVVNVNSNNQPARPPCRRPSRKRLAEPLAEPWLPGVMKIHLCLSFSR